MGKACRFRESETGDCLDLSVGHVQDIQDLVVDISTSGDTRSHYNGNELGITLLVFVADIF